jgi:hypothetical protein
MQHSAHDDVVDDGLKRRGFSQLMLWKNKITWCLWVIILSKRFVTKQTTTILTSKIISVAVRNE